MFTAEQKAIALAFAQQLVNEAYDAAHAMLSQRLQSDISMDALVAAFKDVIDDDWGPIDPLEVDDSEDWPFIYVVLGGDVYSEAILITAWATEDGQPKIDGFELGRP
jgi:hypothetical protein